MKVTLERLPESRVQLEIELDQERIDKSVEAAYRKLAPRARIPGFRPGKAPRAMIERHIGKDRIMADALDALVPDVYNEAIETNDVDAIDQPSLDKIEMEPPVKLSFIVPVRPTVDLGEYRSIRVEPQSTEVTDEMVDEQVLLLRRRHAIHAPVDRGATWNDVLTASVKGTADDDEFINDEDAEFPLREGQVLVAPGLAEAIVGMKKGDEKTVEIEIPEDFRVERLQGKTATFALKVTEVKEEQLPDEDDELAAQVNADEFPTFDALRERIRADLQKSIDDQELERVRVEAVDRLVDGATLDYPAVMVEREIDHIINETTGTDRQQYVSYLTRVGRSEAEYRDTLRPAAEARLRRALAVSKLAEEEAIDVTPGDVEAELDRMAEPMGEQAERMREVFGSEAGRSTIHRSLHSQKTLDRLVAIARGEPSDDATPAAPATAKPKARRTKAKAKAPTLAAADTGETPEEASE